VAVVGERPGGPCPTPLRFLFRVKKIAKERKAGKESKKFGPLP